MEPVQLFPWLSFMGHFGCSPCVKRLSKMQTKPPRLECALQEDRGDTQMQTSQDIAYPA